jgi:hypothetical protein
VTLNGEIECGKPIRERRPILAGKYWAQGRITKCGGSPTLEAIMISVGEW